MLTQRIPFAIIGMACRLPGADCLKQYWNLLKNGQSAIVRVPDERLHYDLYFDPVKGKKGKTYMDQAGLIDYKAFNNCQCPFPIDVAGRLEAGHLLMCETAADACRQAGLDPFDLPYRRAGVYVGNNQSGDLGSELAYSVLVEEAAEYLLDLPEFCRSTGENARQIVAETVRDIRSELPRYGEKGLPTVAYHLTAAAVTRALGLDGPAMVFDAACSSSLQALAVATRDLALGNTEMAIVGGASFFRVDSLMIFSAASSGSAKGSRPFSDLADGLIPAEGYVAVVVKTLERALADGDPIQAVVHGIGVSSDGKGKSLWAPSSDGQYEAIVRSYESAERMGRLAYLEGHATSTAVGDLTELNALTRAFEGKFADGKKRPIGGVKANIGHALEAAGLAGLVKAVLVLQHNLVPPQINCEPFNSKVDWERLPFFVPRTATELAPSRDGLPRMAGVNSFGIGGLNVHVALEDSPSLSTARSVSFARSGETKANGNGSATVSANAIRSVQVRPAEGLSDAAKEPIAIVGFGAVLPGARTLADFEATVFEGKNVFSDVSENRWNARIGIRPQGDSYRAPFGRGGFVVDFEYDWRRHKIPPKQIASADPLQFMIMDAADSALADAGYDRKPLDRTRTGVLVGSSFDTDFSLALSMGFRQSHFRQTLKETLRRFGLTNDAENESICEAYFKMLCERMSAINDETGSFTPSSLSSRITKTFNLTGGGVTTEAGEAGSFAAISEAVNILRLRENDLMIVAAGSRALGLPTFIRTGLAGRLSDGIDVRSALDANGGKTVPGEGAGVLVLKRLSDALADGDRIRAVLHGIGCSSVSPQATSDQKIVAFRRAIDRAWRQTNASRENVRFAELSGTSSDIVEAELTATSQEYRATKENPLTVGEATSQFGDLFAASGVLSLFKAQLELSQGRVPKQFGFDEPNPVLRNALENVRVPKVAESTKTLKKTKANSIGAIPGNDSAFAVVSNWDSCGFFYHAVLEYRSDGRYETSSAKFSSTDSISKQEESVDVNRGIRYESTPNLDSNLKPVSIVGQNDPWTFLRFGASSRQGLIRSFQALKPLDRPFGSNDVERAVVLVPSDGSESWEALLERLAFAAEKLQEEQFDKALPLLERKNIFYGRKLDRPGKIAFLFSGQGSQYPAMLSGLIRNFEPTRDAAQEMNRDLSELGFPNFEDLTITNADLLGTDVFRTQLSLLCADWLVFRSLDALGVRPDVVAGHSFGEFPALVAGGTWNFAQGAQATRVRCDAISECRDALGGMLSTSADAATAKKICDLFPGQAFPANLNAPNQTVVGGRVDILPAIEQLLKKSGFVAKIIPVPRPFHTPLMQSVRPVLAERLNVVPTQKPTLRFISSVTNRPVESSQEILQNLADQMTRSIDYVGLVRRLVDEEGATLLVESGPKRVLTGLHTKIFATSASDSNQSTVRFFAPDLPRCENGLGLFQLRAFAEVEGYLDAADRSGRDESKRLGDENVSATVSKSASSPLPSNGIDSVSLSEQARQSDPSRNLNSEAEFGDASEIDPKTVLIKERKRIRALLAERAIQASPEKAGSFSARTSDERSRTIDEFADILGVLPESLDVWLRELRVEKRSGQEIASAILNAVRGWQNSFERLISATEANNRANGRTVATIVDESKTEAVNSARSTLPDETPSETDSPFISPVDFYRVVSQDEAPKTKPDRKYRRFKVVLMDKELPSVDRSKLDVAGRVLVYGDNPTARELEKRLAGSEREIVVLPCSGNPEQDAAAAEKICEEKSTLHLFLLASHDEAFKSNSDGDDWNRRRGISLGSYAVAQRWFIAISRSKRLARASLVASTVLGGGFGVVDPSESVEAGCLAGLTKSLDLEAGFPTNFAFRSKIVDFAPTDSPEFKADKILDVLAANVPYEVETGFVEGRRVLPRLIPATAKQATDETDVRRPAGRWVITGGGRGITAFLARGIAKRFGLELFLLGTSPLPNVPENWKNLDATGLKTLREEIVREATAAGENPQSRWNRTERAIALAESLDLFAQEGIKATYFACDVSNRTELANVLDKIRSGGSISGILHGAGLEVSTSFEKKDFDVVKKTFSIKTEGAKNLIDLTRNDPIRHFLGLGSIAGRFGSLGQSDYSMANDGLAKLLDRLQRERPDCRVSLFHWGPWDEIGMAVRPEMKSNPILSQMTFLPPAEGLDYVLEELNADAEPVEKVFMAWDYFKLFYPLENNTPTENEKKAAAEREKKATKKRASSIEPTIDSSANVRTAASVSVSTNSKNDLSSNQTDWDAPPVPYKMERWEGRTIRANDWSNRSFVPKGNAIIYGNNEDSYYLRKALERRGIDVLLLPEQEDPRPLLNAIEEFWKKGAAPHLFLTSARSNIKRPLSASDWTIRRREQYMTPSWICRLWLRLLTRDGLLDGATVAAATAQGGGFGFRVGNETAKTSNAAADGAQIGGILKCIYMENGLPGGDGVIVRILDAPDETDPNLVAEALIAELTSDDVGVERCAIDGKRFVPRLLAVPVRSYPKRRPEPSGGVWIVPGGGRGITARAALALGKRFGISLHLLGTSPIPTLPEEVFHFSEKELVAYKKQIVRDGMKKGLSPEKAWGPIRKGLEIERNMREMTAAGIKVDYRRCDVLDKNRLADVLDEIRRTDGPIEGVLYGAGIDGIPATVRDIIDAQFASDEILTAIKTDAVLNLWELLQNDPLKYFIGFGSISGRFGSASASSYCSANDALCKTTAYFRRARPDVCSFSFHWHGWDEIGMMTRPVSYGSIKILKMELTSPEEGTSRLIDEILAGAPSDEVIVTDRHYFSTFYSPEMEIVEEPTRSTNDVRPNVTKKSDSASDAAEFPIVERVLERRDVGGTFEACFRPATDPFLRDHQLRGKPLLPAVISAESFCEAVLRTVPNERIAAIRNLTFKDGLLLNGTDPKTVKIRVEATEPRRWNCKLLADFYNTKGKLVVPDRVHCEGTVETAGDVDWNAGLNKDSSSERLRAFLSGDVSWTVPPSFDGVERHEIEYFPPGAAMYHGPVFQQLKRCSFFDSPSGPTSWGELIVLPLADFAGNRKGTWILPAATIDACLYQCGVSVWYRTGGKIGLPKSLGVLRLGRLPSEGERCRIVCRSVAVSSRGVSEEEVFQFALLGADDRILLTGYDYVCQVLTY